MTDFIKPIVNLNGTSKESLMTDLMAALRAVRLAQQAMAACTPNGRDYQTYPESWEVTRQARNQHVAEARKLKEVEAYLNQMAEAIDEQA